MLYTIAPTPCLYNGRVYRSRHEAQVAAFMDLLGIMFTYEPNTRFRYWLKDFILLGRLPVLVEARPVYTWPDVLGESTGEIRQVRARNQLPAGNDFPVEFWRDPFLLLGGHPAGIQWSAPHVADPTRFRRWWCAGALISSTQNRPWIVKLVEPMAELETPMGSGLRPVTWGQCPGCDKQPRLHLATSRGYFMPCGCPDFGPPPTVSEQEIVDTYIRWTWDKAAEITRWNPPGEIAA